ncbi:unnamed protein product [Pieris brassicae]|uniref:Uncharacterized protein n=1 Tax=Pieris brassicae TaxID=7116 RepID=A0A9P0U0K0_PIEBR|nr:unnamed protein product [Pieris brassicae]
MILLYRSFMPPVWGRIVTSSPEIPAWPRRARDAPGTMLDRIKPAAVPNPRSTTPEIDAYRVSRAPIGN